MKIKQYITMILGAMLILASCQNNDDLSGNNGEVRINVLTENSLSTRAEVTPTQQMALQVLDANDQIVKSYDDVTAITENIVLPSGTYTFKAYSFNQSSGKGGWEEEYYEGTTSVTIAKGTLKEVKIVCKLAVAKVSVNYANSVKESFTTLDCTVGNGNESVTFGKDEKRSAYFPASGNLNISLALVNTKGEKFTLNNLIEDVKPCTHYHINYNLSSTGKGDFNITYDPSTNEYTFEVKLPLGTPYTMTLGEPDVYGKVAYVYGSSTETDNTGLKFQYRLKGTEDWVSISAQALEDGTYMAKTNELDFAKEYEYCMAVNNEPTSSISSFTTEQIEEIPNLGFETWNSAKKGIITKKDCWYPNEDAADSYWATGNSGVILVTNSNTTPVEGDDSRTGKAAKMTTVDGIMIVGQAAGNLFIGSYATNTSNPEASVSFGRPYSGARPLNLTGYYKYEGKEISNNGTQPEDASFTQDEGEIYILVWDAADNLIGEGHFYPKGTVNTYTPFSIDVNYTSKAKAAKLTIVCTSSRYGGIFSGTKVAGKVGAGSTLWVDDFSLSYYK